MLQFWLGGLTVLVLGLAAFVALSAIKARQHRMATDARLDGLGRELAERVDALNRRCDDLRAAVDRLGTLADRVRLLELEREVAGLFADGKLDPGAAGRLEAAVATLRQDLGAGER